MMRPVPSTSIPRQPAVVTPKGQTMRHRIKPPSPQYVGPSPHIMHDADGRPMHNTPKLLVVHGTVTPCVNGERFNVARIFRDPRGRAASAHYVTDPAGHVQVVYDHLVADHCGLNPDSLGHEYTIELPSPEWDKAHAHRWDDHAHSELLRRGANLDARLCLAYGIPTRRVTAAQVRAWVHGGRRHPLGICGHDTITEAFPNLTSHWDPGPAFPWGAYLAQVHKHAAYLQRKARRP